MKYINLSTTTFVGISTILLFLILSLAWAIAEPNTHAPEAKLNDLEASKTASNQTVKPTSVGRSRSGRMLDLDHLAGDIGKDEKLAKEQKASGSRQSRILSEDLPLNSQEQDNVEPRGRVKSKGKKMAIKGFIPIVSLEGASGKDGKNLMESQLGGSDDDEDADNQSDDSEQQQQQQSLREQVAANFGGQTSIGHASFANNDPHQQLASNGQQWQQMPSDQEAARANRKLLGSSNILASLTNSKRFVSSLVPSSPFGQHQQQFVGGSGHLQGPMNVPPVASLFEQQQQAECICVPFFQCKNGFLSESQLSKSQLAQISSNHHHHLQHPLSSPFQVPRSLANNQQGELYQTSQVATNMMPSNGNQFASQPNDQQMVNDIYEQLRKNIESSNLEQQLQAYQQQQQQQQQQFQQPLVDERSKSGSNATDLEERSLLNQLAQRRSSMGSATKCGIMRTCCRIPPTMLQRQHLPGARLVGPPPPPPQVALGRPQQVVGAPSNFQPQYQMLQPSRQQPAQFEQPIDHQQAFQDQPPAMLTSSSGPPVSRPGQFMSGRCGVRQTLGISGRVQNSPAQQQGQENSADFGEFPAHAAILRRLSPGDSLFVCSAVLISGQWLATAAHCVKKLRPEELKVRLGEWDVQRDDEFYPFVETNVREIIWHPEFQPASLVNDVALLRLETPVDQQQMPHVAPACLATPDEQFAGQRCWVAGWGKDAFGQSGAFQSVLKKVDLPVVSHHDCELALKYQTKLGKHFRLHQNNICAGGERGKDACEGDGGAGLYCLDQQSGLIKAVGLVSWGVGCGQRGVPGVYANLAHFQQWIEHVVATSGEENIYNLDGRQQLADQFKSIISERTINGTSAGNSTLERPTTR